MNADEIASIRIGKAAKHVSDILGCNPEYISKMLTRFSRIKGSGHKIKQMISTKRADQINSYFTEVWYSLVFAGLSFHVELEPLGKRTRGPDLRISKMGYHCLVEIKHFVRSDSANDEPPLAPLSFGKRDVLQQYGDPQRDQELAYRAIVEKFPQANRDASMLVLWSDRCDWDLATKCAVDAIMKDADRGTVAIPPSLMCVIVGSDWSHRGQQLFAFPFGTLHQPYSDWVAELSRSGAVDLVERALSKS